MKIETWAIGETAFEHLEEGIAMYSQRIERLLPSYAAQIIPDVKQAKNLSESQLKSKEAEAILKKLDKNDILVLLDENGQQFTSRQFAEKLDFWQQQQGKKIVFLIGGAFGFDEEIYERANAKVALSKLTFSHQLVRLIWAEQLYRALAILNNLPYHHD